nr:hypothetical protein [uncultured Carboxylicivirga sp.]
MKRLNVIAALMLLLTVSINAQTKVETLTEFLDGIIKFENATIQESTPIADIKNLAAAQADKMLDLNKETIAEVLETAKAYHFCVITVGVHTIARITDLENCQQSGSWGQCMPMSEGFVQKSGLTNINDYLNNVIGIPNSQERKVFFFMKK